MSDHRVVSREEWLEARRAFLAKEKELTHARDRLSEERRALPWVRVEQDYVFHGSEGDVTLSALFKGRSQLAVYHFMFGPDWEAGCRSCSFWADGFAGILAHLEQRDLSVVAVSRAPLAKLRAYATRMGWSFEWVSSFGSDFNLDFGVSFDPADVAEKKPVYNFGTQAPPASEMHGISTFYKDERGRIFHAYSSYGRGVEPLNPAYAFLDVAPKGRDEGGRAMSWLRRRDEY